MTLPFTSDAICEVAKKYVIAFVEDARGQSADIINASLQQLKRSPQDGVYRSEGFRFQVFS
ncbi:MAG: hypothetical protein IJA87_08475 [Clostridia bacterium]|nr:hypothetical protein [Clostridia bacterium]